MEITEASVRELVEQVLTSLDGKILRSAQGTPAIPSAAVQQQGVFPDIDAAVAAARRAHSELMSRTLEIRTRMIASMRQAVLKALDRLADLAVRETGMGRRTDKVQKNRVAAELTPGVEDLQPVTFSHDLLKSFRNIRFTDW